MEENKNNKKNKTIIIILSVVIAICIAVIVVLLLKKRLDYNPIEIDPNAQELKDDGKKLTEDGTLNAVRLSYSTKVKVSLDKKEATLSFKNPSASNQNMVLIVQVLDGKKEIEIAKSQSVPVGYYINKLKLNDGVSLKKGKYKGQFVINYYKDGTNEKSMLDTKTPITIEVS